MAGGTYRRFRCISSESKVRCGWHHDGCTFVLSPIPNQSTSSSQSRFRFSMHRKYSSSAWPVPKTYIFVERPIVMAPPICNIDAMYTADASLQLEKTQNPLSKKRFHRPHLSLPCGLSIQGGMETHALSKFPSHLR